MEEQEEVWKEEEEGVEVGEQEEMWRGEDKEINEKGKDFIVNLVNKLDMMNGEEEREDTSIENKKVKLENMLPC